MRVDWDNPISDHPLNRGLVSRWQVGEDNPLWGGPKLYDLAGLNHGTLTNFAASVNPWSGPLGRQGGFGSLSFDGSDDKVSIAANAAFDMNSTPFTFACWVKSTSTGGAHLFGAYDLGGIFNGWGIRLLTTMELWQGSSWVASTASPSDGNWHHVAVSVDGSNANFYLDGRPNGSPASGLPNSYTGNVAIANRSTDTAAPLSGIMDDVRIHRRALSASEVYSLFRTSQEQYDPTLNWIRPRKYFFVDGGGGGGPAFSYLTLLGVG